MWPSDPSVDGEGVLARLLHPALRRWIFSSYAVGRDLVAENDSLWNLGAGTREGIPAREGGMAESLLAPDADRSDSLAPVGEGP